MGKNKVSCNITLEEAHATLGAFITTPVETHFCRFAHEERIPGTNDLRPQCSPQKSDRVAGCPHGRSWEVILRCIERARREGALTQGLAFAYMTEIHSMNNEARESDRNLIKITLHDDDHAEKERIRDGHDRNVKRLLEIVHETRRAIGEELAWNSREASHKNGFVSP